MLYSMTGFGRSVLFSDDKKITVEIKSLNSKQLDLTMRLPSIYRDIDIKVREMLSSGIERGKVDVSVYVEKINDKASEQCEDPDSISHFNVPFIRSIKKSIDVISENLEIPVPNDWFQVFLRFPETLHSDAPAPIATPDEVSSLFDAFSECLKEFSDYRAEEGKKLYDFFEARINRIEQLLKEISVYETERVDKIKERIKDGLSKLDGMDINENRLEQEMIYYIEKLDVNEEKQRLTQHLNYFKETMNCETVSKGKKLGFISQEMGREINTLGSKSNHADMQKIVVMMKDELEQIKEQVLNVL